ncbi:MAG: folate-binding protein YgfZ [bacterium]|nr:folate-binding protein YgfZ [bacterium]
MSLVSLSSRSFLSLQGEDPLPFLQGLVTQDVLPLQPGQALYTLLLNPQGRYESDFFVLHKNSEIILDIPRTHLKFLKKKLTFYKMRRPLEVLDVSDQWQVLALFGEDAMPSLPKESFYYDDPRLPKAGKRILWPSKDALPKQLSDPDFYENHRLNLGLLESEKDLIPGKTIPLEANMEFLKAISWSKGCYLGQELTTRTYHQGLVRKRLLPVHLQGPLPAPQDPIFCEDKKVGTFSSGHQDKGIALLRLEHTLKAIKERKSLRSGDTLITPNIPSWINL